MQMDTHLESVLVSPSPPVDVDETPPEPCLRTLTSILSCSSNAAELFVTEPNKEKWGGNFPRTTTQIRLNKWWRTLNNTWLEVGPVSVWNDSSSYVCPHFPIHSCPNWIRRAIVPTWLIAQFILFLDRNWTPLGTTQYVRRGNFKSTPPQQSPFPPFPMYFH